MLPEPNATVAPAPDIINETPARHTRLVKSTHWLITIAFLILAFTGFTILKAHPRLYWGEVGNDLTPAFLELPISRNYKHGGWTNATPFFARPASPISASRTIGIYNQNSWGRSLHFLAGWILVATGAAYLFSGFLTNHLRQHLVPRSAEFSPRLFWNDFMEHVRLKIRTPTGGPQYGLLQKTSYFFVVFIALPLTGITGLAMSPTITAAFPFLSGMFGGFQSARTIHFFLSVFLALFLLIHVVMIIKSGFKRQMRAMTIGE
jgi:thiosulfate reductase cytochrome b subunit